MKADTSRKPSGRIPPDWENQERNELGQFGLKGDEPMSKKVTGVRLPVRVTDAINTLGKAEKSEWLRRILTEAAEKELLKN
jgi:hypothetical protein